MKISVLTPTYNRGELLHKLYESLLKNSGYGVDIEWLIMDDGSTDKTEEIVKKEYFASIPAKYKNEIEEKNQKIPEIIGISAKNRQGIQTLEETLKNMFFEGNLSFNDEIYITNVRQKAALQDAKEALLQVLESIRNGMPEDFYSIDLMAAYEALGSITGETIGEDLVNEIFSKFCMGK